MGYRLHVQKKHVIEYTDNTYFHYGDIEIFNEMIWSYYYPGNYIEYINEDGMKCIELEKEYFKKMIDKIKENKKEVKQTIRIFNKKYSCNTTYKQLLESLQKIYDDSCEGAYIYLDWF